MYEEQQVKQPVGVWILVALCALAVVFTLVSGAAYTGVSQARLVAAKASLGQIESTFYLAEKVAEDSGLKPPEGSYDNLLKSYDDGSGSTLSEYEKVVLDTMQDVFGNGRDFDFAVTRYADNNGSHTRVYYFPTKGANNLNQDRYYMTIDGRLVDETT